MSSKRTPKKLGDLLRQAGADAKPSPTSAPPENTNALVVKSISLTPGGLEMLGGLIRDISLHNRRKTNASAVVRALLRYVSMEPDATKRLAAIVHSEISTGEVVWGKSKA